MTGCAPYRSTGETASRPADRGERVGRLLSLLQRPAPLILPSAWDAGTARLLEHAGAAAVAVSAAAVAWSFGCSGGQPLRDEELVAACARVCRSVALPVTADLRGVPDAAQDVPALVDALVARGVVGLTLPDARRPDDDWRLLDAVRASARRSDVPLHVTAHVGADGAPNATRSERLARWRETLCRARACAEAGADGVLITGLDWAAVVSLVRELPVPVCVDIGGVWAPPAHGLALAGVRCIALGIGPLRAAVGALRGVAVEAFERGSYDLMNRAIASADVTCGPA